jgi:hypothetical protein
MSLNVRIQTAHAENHGRHSQRQHPAGAADHPALAFPCRGVLIGGDVGKSDSKDSQRDNGEERVCGKGNVGS